MPRKAIKTKVINGITYYTSNYFVDKCYVSPRVARNYLEDFSSLEGHTNPKLYDKDTINKAIASYCYSPKTKERYQKIKQQIMLEGEIDRAYEAESLISEDVYPDPQNDYAPTTSEEIEIRNHKLLVEKTYIQKLPIMLLKHLLFIQGYEFDEDQFLSDLDISLWDDNYRDERETPTDKVLEAKVRLRSNDGYFK